MILGNSLCLKIFYFFIFHRIMDIDDRIDSSHCGDEYRAMEECIVESNRDWRKCKSEVENFKQCMKKKR